MIKILLTFMKKYQIIYNTILNKAKVCYHFNSRGRNMAKKMCKSNEGIMDARSLACYIKKCYEKKFNGDEISPIKLQKSLYFCFAYWGGFVRRGKSEKTEFSTNKYSEILFSNKIEAWVYGPVVPDVYHEKNLEKYEDNSIFTDGIMQNYINGILDDVLVANDFKLVEVSHQDKCWKKHFNKKSIFHNDTIPADEIISEYAKI